GIHFGAELSDSIWKWLATRANAPDKPTAITLQWQNVVPVALNGTPLPLDQVIEQLNIIGGANGIGKIDLFEDGIMGLESREIYEAPAATILLKLHRDLEQFCLTKEEIQVKRQLDAEWARLVY